MVTYIEFGNIFELQGVYNYAHGCNCAGAMGKGIALQFKKKYPKMYLEYKKKCHEGLFYLGDLYVYKYNKETIFNLGTQISWKTNADINAIELSLIKMLFYASQNNIYKIALPRIGAGLGGLNWNSIKEVINRVAKDYPNIHLYIVENYIEG